AQRAGSSTGLDRARDHDPADGGGRVSGRATTGALSCEGSRLRHGCDTLGGDLEGDASDGVNGHLRRPRTRLRPRPRRDDGAGHADRKLEPAEPVPVLTGEHLGRPARAEFPGGWTARSPGADVRCPRAPWHHPAGEHRRRRDHESGGAERPPVSARTVSAIEGRAGQSAGTTSRPIGPSLRRSPWEARALRSGLLTTGAWAAAILASIPLFSVLYMLIVRGGSRLTWEAIVELPPAGFEMGGGFGNAIVGTVVM